MKNYYISIIRRGELSFIRNKQEEFGLNPLEGRLIRILMGNCYSQEELGGCLDIDKGRIAKTIFSLEEKGLIRREVNEKNRRQKLVSLTEKGIEMYETIAHIYEEWDDICYEGFTEEERKQSHEFIKRISANVLEYKKENGGNIHG